MEEQYQNELAKIIKKERMQKRITKYVSGIGKWLLLVLPWFLVIITILAVLAYVNLIDFT